MTITELHDTYDQRKDLVEVARPAHRKSKVREVIQRLVGEGNKSILDVGCATGEILKPFTMSNDITGMDCYNAFLGRAKANGYLRTENIDAFNDTFPFGDCCFDIAFCGECIEHGVDTDWLLCEINRVIKPDGNLVLTFPNIRTPISFLTMLLNRAPMFAARLRAEHVRDFTTASIRAALTENGFKVLKMVGVDFCVSSSPNGVLPQVASFFPSLASTVVVVAQKVFQATYRVH